MTYRTYQLHDGAFATSSVQVPTDYVRAWDITEEQAAHINAGADVAVDGDALVITPLPTVEAETIYLPAEGDF